jgi:hypothetical protein
MAIFHIRIKKSNENITISKEILAQKLTLIRATIYKDTTTGGTDYNGSVFIDLDFFNGFEVTTNLNDNFLILPVSYADEIQTRQMDQEFNGEDVKSSFNVKVFYEDNNNNIVLAPMKSDASATDTGKIIWIDLYFQIQSLYDYSTY